VQALAELTARIQMLDREISALARTQYPQTLWLQQIRGVGPITAPYFVLKIEDPSRFENVRDIGAYAGLCPRRDQSGESDPQLRISKRGDAYLRRLLVSAAQYILGPFGPASALREYGLMLAADGNRRAKKRAVVAFALGALITVVFGYIFILGSLIVGIAHLSGISWTWIAKFFQR
jgi:transposase